ncbi:MAG: aminotransferase class V-fold PLP-dependent enzyme, partial [Oscillospiraceae bacterium]
TENIPYIAGFATAVEMLLPTTKQRLHNAEELVKYMRQKLGEIEGIKINSPENACPYNFNFSCVGIRSETLLHHLEGFDVYVSSGSACSKGKGSHTLTAMGLENNIIDSALRISVCKDTTIQDINTLILGVKDGIKVLSKR